MGGSSDDEESLSEEEILLRDAGLGLGTRAWASVECRLPRGLLAGETVAGLGGERWTFVIVFVEVEREYGAGKIR